MHDSQLSGIVIQGIMHGTAVVPDSEYVPLPTVAELKFGTQDVLTEIFDERPAFLPGHAAKLLGGSGVDKEALAAGFRNRPENRMRRRALRGLLGGAPVRIGGQLGQEILIDAIDQPRLREQILHANREGI